MSFSYGANVAKASEARKALDAQRDRLYDAGRADADDEDAAARRGEVEELSAAAHAAAEAAVRKLDGSGYQLSVSGHRNPDGVRAVSVSVTALP